MEKKRKSTGRRRSRSLSGFASKDICETIPKSLESSDRLLLLVERCFQYALTAAQKNLMLEENIDVSQFRKDSVDCWEKVKSEIDEENLCKAAVTESTTSNQSLFTEKNSIEEKAILEAEHNEWNERIAHYREELKEELSNPCKISADWEGKEMLFDYSDVVESTSFTQKKLERQIASLKQTNCLIQDGIKCTNEISPTLIGECEKYFESKRTNTPRSIIRKMGENGKIVKHHRYS